MLDTARRLLQSYPAPRDLSWLTDGGPVYGRSMSGGLSAQSVLLSATPQPGAGAVVLRIPDLERPSPTGVQEGYDLAEQAGLAPALLSDGGRGVTLTDYLPHPVLTVDALSRPDVLQRAVTALYRLHRLGRTGEEVELSTQFHAADMAYKGNMPPLILPMVSRGETAGLALRDTAPRTVAVHHDPVPQNLVDDGEKIWLLDFEYCGDDDPTVDLAALMVEADATPEAIINGYQQAARLAGDPDPTTMIGSLEDGAGQAARPGTAWLNEPRLMLYGCMYAALWPLWARSARPSLELEQAVEARLAWLSRHGGAKQLQAWYDMLPHLP